MNIDLIGLTDKPKPLRHTLWCFYDEEGALIYVTKNVNQAIMKDKNWWYDKATIKCTHYASADEVEAAKVEAIQTGKPKWNIHNNNCETG